VGGLVDEATDKVVKGVSKNAPGKVLMRGDGMGADPETIPAEPRRKNSRLRIARRCATSSGRVASSRASEAAVACSC